jgi:hypothetical protein
VTIPLAIECPECRAVPGQQCHDPSEEWVIEEFGKLRTTRHTPHAARIQAAGHGTDPPGFVRRELIKSPDDVTKALGRLCQQLATDLTVVARIVVGDVLPVDAEQRLRQIIEQWEPFING